MAGRWRRVGATRRAPGEAPRAALGFARAEMSTRIHLCGAVSAQIDGERIEPRLPRRQGVFFFAFLVLNRRRPLERDTLMEAVWPGERPPAAGAAFRALLSKTRTAVGSEALRGRERIQLALPPDAWIDVEAAAEAIHRAETAVASEPVGRGVGRGPRRPDGARTRVSDRPRHPVGRRTAPRTRARRRARRTMHRGVRARPGRPRTRSPPTGRRAVWSNGARWTSPPPCSAWTCSPPRRSLGGPRRLRGPSAAAAGRTRHDPRGGDQSPPPADARRRLARTSGGVGAPDWADACRGRRRCPPGPPLRETAPGQFGGVARTPPAERDRGSRRGRPSPWPPSPERRRTPTAPWRATRRRARPRDHRVDETPLEGDLGGYRRSAEKHLHRPTAANQTSDLDHGGRSHEAHDGPGHGEGRLR